MNHKLTNQLNVYLEVGSRRTFASAIDWPGWCRMGPDEATALQTLFDYGPRYARILRPARLGFQVPNAVSAFAVVERLKGNATTDFGAPDLAPASDTQPLNDTELRRLQALLKACWRAFDAAVERANGKTLRVGPRGGKRWPPRYFVRREAWHVLDHIWEIEDRLK